MDEISKCGDSDEGSERLGCFELFLLILVNVGDYRVITFIL